MLIFPNELMVKIINYCDTETLFKLKQINQFKIFCKNINRAIYKNGIKDWKEIYYDNLKDYASAQLYFLSDVGTPSSQFKLGLMHWKGHGTRQDNIEALKWFNISNFTSNSNDMDIYIAEIKKVMTHDELDQSNSLFKALKEEITKTNKKIEKSTQMWKKLGNKIL